MTPEQPQPNTAPSLAAASGPLFVLAAILVGLLTALVGFNTLAARAASGQPSDITYRVDINRADANTLQLLPGVGDTLAQNIIAERTPRAFADSRDLLRVRGIGAKLASRIEPFVDFK